MFFRALGRGLGASALVACSILALVRCSSFESESPAVVEDAPSAPVNEAAVPDSAALEDANDGGCVGILIDDFDRGTFPGGPWNEYRQELGTDAGVAAVVPIDGGRAGYVSVAAGNLHAMLTQELPSDTKYFEISFDHIAGYKGSAPGTWFATYVDLSLAEPTANVDIATVTPNGVYGLGAFRKLLDAGLDASVNVASEFQPLALRSEGSRVRLVVTFGAQGRAELSVDGKSVAMDFPTSSVKKRVSLGLAVEGRPPTVVAVYSKVRACWR